MKKPIKSKPTTYSDHRKDPPYCWRVGVEVTLDKNGKCPECGWTGNPEEVSISWKGWKGCLKAIFHMSTTQALWSTTQLVRALEIHGYQVEWDELRQELTRLVDQKLLRRLGTTELYKYLNDENVEY